MCRCQSTLVHEFFSSAPSFGSRPVRWLTSALDHGVVHDFGQSAFESTGTPPRELRDEFGHDEFRDDAQGVATGEQLRDSLTAPWAEIERPVVHVHAHEFVGFTMV